MTMHYKAETRPNNPTEERKSREALEAFAKAFKPPYMAEPASVIEAKGEYGEKVLKVEGHTHFDHVEE
jgi:hypothetical protein